MRTSVEIDNALLEQALLVSGLPTKRAVIEAGLNALIQLHAQQRIRTLRGQLRWEGNLNAVRTDRDEG